MDFTAIWRAGLTQTEAAYIVGVSRVMVWKYLVGRAAPSVRRIRGKASAADRMKTLVLVLEKLIEKGSLPKNDLVISPLMDPEIRARREKMVEKIKALVDERVALVQANT